MRAEIDTSSLSRFSRRLKAEDPEVFKALRKQVRTAGAIVRDDAKGRTSSVKARRSLRLTAGATTATITVRGTLPVLLEGDGTPGTWRHPVFGNRNVWVAQQRHPFLHPAAEERGDDVRRLIGQGVTDAAKRAFGQAAGDG